MIKAVAWDIDGTLVDSEPLHLFALQQVCRAHSVDISDLADEHFIGVHIGDVWRALQPRFPAEVNFKAWSRQIEAEFSAHRQRLVEVPGAVETIRSFAALGVRQVAVSNSNRQVVDTNLDAIGVTGYMEVTISLDDVCEGKPDPFPYRLACYRLGLDPCDVLAVEDSSTGVASAVAAGLRVARLSGPPGAGTERTNAIERLSEVLRVAARAPEEWVSESV